MAPSREVQRIIDALTPEVEGELAAELARRKRERNSIDATSRLRQVAEVCGIQMLYHVVVAAQGFVSLAERDWL